MLWGNQSFFCEQWLIGWSVGHTGDPSPGIRKPGQGREPSVLFVQYVQSVTSEGVRDRGAVFLAPASGTYISFCCLVSLPEINIPSVTAKSPYDRFTAS